jgi:hypothetical protein
MRLLARSLIPLRKRQEVKAGLMDYSCLVATAETEDQVQGGFLLNVIVRKRAAVLELLAGKDQTLLVRGDALLVLDLGLDVIDRIRRLHIQGDGLSSKRLDKDLHSSAETEHQMQGGFLLNVVVRKRATVFELLAGKDQTLLVRGDSFLVLNLGLDVVNRIGRLHVQGDGLSGERLHKDLFEKSEQE